MKKVEIPTAGEAFGAWVVRPVAPKVLIPVECIACGFTKFMGPDRLRDDDRRHGRPCCPECGHGAIRQDRGGTSKDTIYKAWHSMRHRCSPDAHPRNRKNYYDRGIVVCAEWADDYDAFRAWALQNGHVPGLELDRRDTNGIYEPSNCRWVTRKENGRNRRTTVMLTAWGETKSLPEWIEDPRAQVGSYFRAYDRLFRTRGRKWTAEEALSTPARGWQRRA